MKKLMYKLCAAIMFAALMMLNVTTTDFSLDGVSTLVSGSTGNDKGTLMGNEAGTKFCCAEGTNDCSAAGCP